MRQAIPVRSLIKCLETTRLHPTKLIWPREGFRTSESVFIDKGTYAIVVEQGDQISAKICTDAGVGWVDVDQFEIIA